MYIYTLNFHVKALKVPPRGVLKKNGPKIHTGRENSPVIRGQIFIFPDQVPLPNPQAL